MHSSIGWTRKACLFVVAVVLLGAFAAAGPVDAGQEPPQSAAVLVSDWKSSPNTRGRPAGLWRVGPDGAMVRMIGRRWQPIAPSPLGLVAAIPGSEPGRRGVAYAIVRPGEDAVTLRHRTNSLPCAGWSGDGDLLAYLSGERDTYGTRGTLWIAHQDSPREPVAAASGLFPECPVWSSTGTELAYLIQSTNDEDLWEMHVYDGDSSQVVGEIQDWPQFSRVANNHRSFDWAPAGDALVWIQDESLHIFDGNETRSLTEPDALTPLVQLNDGNSAIRSMRFSPGGGFIGVGIGTGAGIFAADGTAVTTARGFFRGWSGDVGILTARPVRGTPSLLLYRAVEDARPELVQKYSKMPILTSPDGDWFAYMHPHVRRRLIFRASDGSFLSRVGLDFKFATLGTSGSDGHWSVPPWH